MSARLRGKKRARDDDISEDEMSGGAAGPSVDASYAVPSTSRRKPKRSKKGNACKQATEEETPVAGPSNDAGLRCGLNDGKCNYAVTHDVRMDTEHLNGHVAVNAHGRFPCSWPGCGVNEGLDDGGYRDKCDRNRHVMSFHWKKRHTCPHSGCGKSYAREHTLKQHLSEKHGRPKRVRKG
ncbi:hypothetical protein C8Q77DRAFT_1270576 [Trametes polyzona]|nr:hypothetical protein C8Q77DRAFT_1270576 [Trametes polyzona]